MAKLSARGRSEVTRFEKHWKNEDAVHPCIATVAIMSDEHVLRKTKIIGGSYTGKDIAINWKDTGKWSNKFDTLQEYKDHLVNWGWKEIQK